MRVLISGGGIAGPALAFWLGRAGHDVTVVEQASGQRPGGHAVDVRGVARRVIELMGIREAIRERQVDERGWGLVDARGRRMAELRADLFGGEGIVAEIEIARGDLARVLHDATTGLARWRFGERITGLRQDPHGVDVTFASGDQSRYDIVAGADGVHSGVRELAFGPHPQFVRPVGGYQGYFTVPDPGDLENWFLMHNAPGGRVVGLRPEHGGTAKASLSFRSHQRLGRLDRDAQVRELTERMAGVGWHTPSLLRALPHAPDLYFDEISRVVVPTWHRGRVVLLGDAGYCGSPLAGQGTSLSLVGALVLAGELAEADTPQQGFAGYQREMADYVTSGTQLPPGGIAAFAPNTALMIRLRALSMRSWSRWPMRPLLAKQFGRADAITLKPYAIATAIGPRGR